MKQMIQRMREEKGGFTLAELLVVVAIIAVMVAIAIPVFTAQLNKANAGTDQANIRGGYAAAQTELISNSSADKNGTFTLKTDGTVKESGTNYTTKGSSNDIDGADNGIVSIGGVETSWGAEGTATYKAVNGQIENITVK